MQCYSRLPLEKQSHTGFKAKDYITHERKKGHFVMARLRILFIMIEDWFWSEAHFITMGLRILFLMIQILKQGPFCNGRILNSASDVRWDFCGSRESCNMPLKINEYFFILYFNAFYINFFFVYKILSFIQFIFL